MQFWIWSNPSEEAKTAETLKLFRKHSVPGITMAEISLARLQSCFGSLSVNFGSKLHWDQRSGSFPPPIHHPDKASKIGPTHESVPSSPQKQCCAGLPECAPSQLFWRVEECLFQESSLQWNKHKDPIWFRNQELQDRLCREAQSCSGKSLNSVPTMLHAGCRAELAFEGTQLDLHSRVLKQKSCKYEVVTFSCCT